MESCTSSAWRPPLLPPASETENSSHVLAVSAVLPSGGVVGLGSLPRVPDKVVRKLAWSVEGRTRPLDPLQRCPRPDQLQRRTPEKSVARPTTTTTTTAAVAMRLLPWRRKHCVALAAAKFGGGGELRRYLSARAHAACAVRVPPAAGRQGGFGRHALRARAHTRALRSWPKCELHVARGQLQSPWVRRILARCPPTWDNLGKFWRDAVNFAQVPPIPTPARSRAELANSGATSTQIGPSWSILE